MSAVESNTAWSLQLSGLPTAITGEYLTGLQHPHEKEPSSDLPSCQQVRWELPHA